MLVRVEKAPVFISWSGEASKSVADALRIWLPKVLQTVDPFVSSQDIAAGNVWFDSIGTQLRRSEFAIICVTRDNLDSPWLHFEAGAIGVAHGTDSDSVPRSVVPLLLDVPMSDLDPPLSLYQALTVSEADLRKLVAALNGIVPVPLSDAALRETFDRWWSDLDAALKASMDLVATEAPRRPQRTERELLEELLSFARTSSFASAMPREIHAEASVDRLARHPALDSWVVRGGAMTMKVKAGKRRSLRTERELVDLALAVPGVERVRLVWLDEHEDEDSDEVPE